MSIHVLSGDSLLESFNSTRITGEVAVFRECFVDGPCEAESLEELYSVREKYLEPERSGFYPSKVRPEIEKVLNAGPGTEIDLWFEHELFCQVNLWFLLHYLQPGTDLFLVTPEVADERQRFHGWRDHGPEELRRRFADRERIESADRELGSRLWKAYSSKDADRMLELGKSESDAFRFLGEVAEAAAVAGSRPEAVLSEYAAVGMNFAEAFRAFCENEPVYGFGDLQVKRIWDSLSQV